MATEVREELERVSAETFCDIVDSLRGNGITEEELQGLLQEVPTDGEGLLSCRQLLLRLRSRDARDCGHAAGTGLLSRAFGRCFPGRPSEPGEEAETDRVDEGIPGLRGTGVAERPRQDALPEAPGDREGQSQSFRELEGSLPDRVHQAEEPPEEGETPGETSKLRRGSCDHSDPGTSKAAQEYDLADKSQLAAFLEDADIQLGGPGTRRISKDTLRVIVRNLKGDRFTVEMLQDILRELVPDREGLLNCEDVARCLRRPDPASEPQEPKRYDLAQKQGLADFLKDADIRLVRADFILKLHREGQRFPRRQEAESAYVDSRTALVTHEEVQDWADGEAPDGTQVVSLSHCWEAREHCDPYGYQVSKLAEALTGKEWLFIDYVSLHQFQRLSQQQNLSFGRAMQHMHVLYCHDETRTVRIESLTPEADVAKAERNQDSVMMYHHPTGLVKPVPVTELMKNRTPYRVRGWCAAEREWSSTRAATNLSREIDAPEDEKGGMAPMSPEAFEKDVAGRLKFTHQNDEKTVCRLQAEVYKEKAKTCRSLRLVDLRADALDIALSALEHYPVLESLEIVHCELRPKLPLLLKALEKIKLRQLHLQQNELFEEGTRQVIEALALQSNGTLTALSLGHVDVAGVKALAEGMKQNRTLKRLSLAGDLREVDLTGCDLGQAVALALARALRTGQVQVKGTITHPALEFLSMLEDQTLEELEETQSLGLRLWGDEAQFRKLFAPLCRALPELKLRWLSLWLGVHGRRLGADEARALAAGLGQQTELERLTLDLFNNSLGEEGAKAVASALTRLTELKELRLDLAENKIGDAGAAAVAESLRNLRQLTVLKVYLRSNALGDAGATAVVESLRELPQLTEVAVQLENNDLGKEEKEKLRAIFAALPVRQKGIAL